MAKNITNADRQFTAPVKAWHTNNNIPKNSITGAMNSKIKLLTMNFLNMKHHRKRF